MSMKMISNTVGSPRETKPMNKMVDGEIAEAPNGNIVLCVTHTCQPNVYLILGDHHTTNSYGSECGILVRPLNSNERINITFTNNQGK